jgi:hypothetical protein
MYVVSLCQHSVLGRNGGNPTCFFLNLFHSLTQQYIPSVWCKLRACLATDSGEGRLSLERGVGQLQQGDSKPGATKTTFSRKWATRLTLSRALENMWYQQT